jgi:hypothetical protein
MRPIPMVPTSEFKANRKKIQSTISLLKNYRVISTSSTLIGKQAYHIWMGYGTSSMLKLVFPSAFNYDYGINHHAAWYGLSHQLLNPRRKGTAKVIIKLT